jgi:hypothetical protein
MDRFGSRPRCIRDLWPVVGTPTRLESEFPMKPCDVTSQEL